ncbi:MAG: thioredoxin family protein [Candidatus Zixiibacteriota bacterium]
MKIEVLGPGCANCRKLEQDVNAALAELGIEAEVVKITDLNKISSYGILMTPGLVINSKIYSSGKIPVVTTLKRWIEEEARKQTL